MGYEAAKVRRGRPPTPSSWLATPRGAPPFSGGGLTARASRFASRWCQRRWRLGRWRSPIALRRPASPSSSSPRPSRRSPTRARSRAGCSSSARAATARGSRCCW